MPSSCVTVVDALAQQPSDAALSDAPATVAPKRLAVPSRTAAVGSSSSVTVVNALAQQPSDAALFDAPPATVAPKKVLVAVDVAGAPAPVCAITRSGAGAATAPVDATAVGTLRMAKMIRVCEGEGAERIGRAMVGHGDEREGRRRRAERIGRAVVGRGDGTEEERDREEGERG